MKKIKPPRIKLSLICIGFSFFLLAGSLETFGQKKCENSGEAVKFTIQNTTQKPLEIKVVGDDCKEAAGKLLKPGDEAGGNSFSGVVFRAYFIANGELIAEIKLNTSQSIYKITEQEPDSSANTVKIEPRDGFLMETNAIRSEKKFAPVELDEKLTNACQWFAELMAEVDKGYPVHTASELGVKELYQKRNKASQRLVYFGWEKKNTAHYEVTALDTVKDYNSIGNNFAKLWAFSKTHYKPFLDKDRVKYNRVGFGFAKAKQGTNRYYACALFGKK